MNTLSAEKRDMQIKAKKLRREGFVTGNVFGKNMEGSMPLKIEKKEAERILRTCNKGSQLILTVEGQKMPVLLKEIDYNPTFLYLQEIQIFFYIYYILIQYLNP